MSSLEFKEEKEDEKIFLSKNLKETLPKKNLEIPISSVVFDHKPESYDLKCLKCGEFLHVRVSSKIQNFKGRESKVFREECFCPVCGTSDKIFKQFKLNRHEKKSKSAITL